MEGCVLEYSGGSWGYSGRHDALDALRDEHGPGAQPDTT